jgi:hypothetical protein
MNGTTEYKKNMSRTDILRELMTVHNKLNDVRLEGNTDSRKLEEIRAKVQKLIEKV